MKKENLKLYLKTTLTLCIMAGVSAAVVGLVNYFTAPTIASNSILREQNACKDIYVDATSFNEEYNAENENKYDFKYIEKAWRALNGESDFYGLVFRCSGKNIYGAISLIIGYNKDYSIEKVEVVENPESFATTVNDYIKTTYNGDTNVKFDDISTIDVTCGATYGAKLVRSMLLEAGNGAKEMMFGESYGK